MNKLSERLRKYGDHEAADALDMLEEALTAIATGDQIPSYGHLLKDSARAAIAKLREGGG